MIFKVLSKGDPSVGPDTEVVWAEDHCSKDLMKLYQEGKALSAWQGAIVSPRGVGMRAAPGINNADLVQARMSIRPSDINIDPETAKVRVKHLYIINGVHVDATPTEFAKSLRTWGWACLPDKAWIKRNIKNLNVGSGIPPRGLTKPDGGDRASVSCLVDDQWVLITELYSDGDPRKLPRDPPVIDIEEEDEDEGMGMVDSVKKPRLAQSQAHSPDKASGPAGLAEQLQQARANLRPVGAPTGVMHPVEASVRIQQLEEVVDAAAAMNNVAAQGQVAAMKAESDRRMQTMEGQIRALSEKHTAFEEKQTRLEIGQHTLNTTISGNATKAAESHDALMEFLTARLGSPRVGPPPQQQKTAEAKRQEEQAAFAAAKAEEERLAARGLGRSQGLNNSAPQGALGMDARPGARSRSRDKDKDKDKEKIAARTPPLPGEACVAPPPCHYFALVFLAWWGGGGGNTF
jgi:hypothetical protein